MTKLATFEAFLRNAAVILLLLAPASVLAQSGNVDDYVLVANSLVQFGRDNSVASGNVGVEASGAQGGEMVVGRRFLGTDGSHLVADRARVSGPSSLFALFSNEASLAPQVLVRAACGAGPCSFPMPILGYFPSIPPMAAGTTDLTVPARTTLTLAPNSYGRIRLLSKSTLILTGGTYNFSEIDAGKASRILFTAPTVVNVTGKVQLKRHTLVGPLGPGAKAQDLLINVESDTVRMRHHVTFAGKMWAPNALMIIGASSLIKGQIIADRVKLARAVVLQAALPLGPFGLRTNTPTQTAIPTDTPPPTPTPTETLVPTDTPVPTETLEPTPTETLVPTATATDTPVPPTATPTETATPQPTDTPTPSPTASETATPAPTNTTMPDDTATATPLATSTATLVPTDTSTPTPTATPTPTSTPTRTFTNTAVPTATFTATSTLPPATATKTPTNTQTATKTKTPGSPIHPIVECVTNNGNGTYTAYFGYKNDNATAMTITVGTNNRFTPSPQDRGQPSLFQPGRTPFWPNAAFSVIFDGSNLVWTLTGPDGATRTATASSGSAPCAEHVFLDKKWYGIDGQPLPGPPESLPANYTLTATSSLGSATCTYSGSTLGCTYTNSPPASDNNGLWVPVGQSYSVAESNLPSDYTALAGTGSFLSQVPGGYCTNPFNGFDKYCRHLVKNMASGPCGADIAVEATNYEQVNYINQALGGTVNQVGGAAPGNPMLTASDFQGSTSNSTGVSVTAPSYIFASTVISSNLSGNSEPGNSPGVVLGPPTDLTFTTPGSGGPDGTDGDGSLVMGGSGNFVKVGFGTTLSTTSCTPRSLILFTNTAGSGQARIELMNGGTVVASINVTVPGGAVESSVGGIAFNINDLTFEYVKVVRLSGTVEVDALAVRGNLTGDRMAALCGDGALEGGEECDDGNGINGDGCSADCRNEYTMFMGTRQCTLSQGGWHTAPGADFIDAVPEILPITIGGPEASTTIHSQGALAEYLPKGGPPDALATGDRNFHSAADVVDDDGGVLAGQIMALDLALRLSASGEVFGDLGSLELPQQPFCTQDLAPGDDGALGTEDDVLDGGAAIAGPWTLPATVATAGTTVSDVVLMGNHYLRGASSAAPIEDVNAAASALNLAFDGCRQIVPCP